MEKEIWKPIVGYEGLYEVSNCGNVRSVRSGRIRFLHPRLHNGYPHITILKNHQMKTFAVHRLVALAFIENPDNKKCIDHINGTKTDNRVDNLRWCTHKENSRNPITFARHIAAHRCVTCKIKIKQSKKTLGISTTIHQYDKDNNYVQTYDSIMDAARAVKGERKSLSSVATRIWVVKDKPKNIAYGFHWRTKRIEPSS